MPDAFDAVLAPQQSLDEYDAVLRLNGDQSRQQLRSSLYGALQTNPDEFAQAKKLEKTTGIPAPVVARNLPEVRRTVQLDEYDRLLDTAPVLGQHLQQTDFASLAHDDTATLARMEAMTNPRLAVGKIGGPAFVRPQGEIKELSRSLFGDFAEPIMRGLARARQGVTLLAADASPEDTTRLATRQRAVERYPVPQYIAAGMQQISSAETFGDAAAAIAANPRAVVEVALESLGVSVPSLIGAAGGSAFGPLGTATGAGAGSFAVEYASSLAESVAASGGNLTDPLAWDKALRNPLLMENARSKALARGIPVAAFDALTAGLAGRFLAKAGPSAASVAGRSAQELGLQAGGGAAGEAGAQLATDEYRPGDILLEAIAEIPSALVEVPLNYREALVRANAADANANAMSEMLAAAAESKLRARSPETFQQYLATAMEGAPAENVWVSPATLEQAGVDINALASISPSFAAGLAQAQEENGEVQIPTAELATVLPGSGFEQTVLQHLRTDPDAPTQAEAQTYLQNQVEEFQRAAKEVTESREFDQAWQQSAQSVENELRTQLAATGRFTESVTNDYAAWAAKMIEVWAARRGVTPEQHYVEFPLDIVGAVDTISKESSLSQAAPQTETPEFKAWFGDSKVVDAEGKPLVVYHGTTEDIAEFDKAKTVDGGFHFGTREQASMRASGSGKNLLPVFLTATELQRSKDMGGNWKAKIKAAKAAGKNGIVYLNRYEGLSTEVIQRLSDEGLLDKLDRMSDADFRRAVPEAQDSYIVFEPTQIKSAIGNRGTFDPRDANILNQPAYHGSPYKFDKFTLDHIGKGEGAQAYGWGLYFAGKRGVAEFYKDSLGAGAFTYDGKQVEGDGPMRAAVELLWSWQGDVQGALDDAAGYDNARAIKAELKRLDYEKITQGGQLYQVDIPEDGEYLLWDKPLSEQPEKVRAALEGDDGTALGVTPFGEKQTVKQKDPNGGVSGGMFYEGLGERLGGREAASKYLNSLGIAGIKYLDGTSRDKGEGSYNYVIFDDSAVEILNTFYQGETTPRGKIAFAEDITQDATRIALLEQADLSTFLHEMGHFQLEVMAHVAAQPDAPADIKADMDAVLKWFGIKGDKDVAGGEQAGSLGQGPLAAPSKVFGRELAPLAIKAYNSLSPDAKAAVDGWNVNWHTGALERAFRTDDALAQEIRAAFSPVREKARALFGDTIPMYRGEQKEKDEQIDPERVLLSWSPVRELGQRFAANYPRDIPPPFSDEEVEQAIKQFNETGFTTFNGVKYVKKNDSEMGDGYYMMYDRNRNAITDGTDIASDLRREQQWRQEWIDDLKARGTLYAADVPVDSLVWIPTGVNLTQPEIIAAYNPRTQPSSILHQGGDEGTKGELPKRRTALEVWQAMSLEERRPYHEQFARGFEAYLFEGNAPTPELTSMFGRFRAWLLHIYRRMSELKVSLTPEVRRVMDRMLATNEQIAQAESLRNMAPLLKEAPTGVDAETWARYQEDGQAATEAAINELQARSLRDMQWLTNARGRELSRLQRQAEGLRKDIEAEVTKEVRAQPIYAARRFLAYGELATVDRTNQERKLLDTFAGKPVKLDLGILKEMYGDGPAAPWRYLPTGKNGLAATEGVSPDLVAPLFGFTSGDQLVRELVAAQPESVVIEGMTDQRMLEEHGDLSSPDAIARAAERAIHNDARARFVATEYKIAAKSATPVQAIMKAAREMASKTIAQKRVRDIKPAQYAAAEARAAKAAERALGASDPQRFAAEVRNKLLNNALAREATRVAAEIEANARYLKKFDKEGVRKNIDIDYRDQIDAILERFDLRTGQTLTDIDKRTKLADWIEAQEEQGLTPVIDPAIADEAFRKHFKDFTVEELRGLVDSIKNIEHLGRLKKKLLTAKDQREFAIAVQELSDSITENAKGVVPEERMSDRGRFVALVRLGKRFKAEHRKFASVAREMDGWQDGGKAWQYLVRPMNDAGNFEAVEREKATIALSSILKPLLAGGAMSQKQYFPSIGKSFTREERIGIALNMGNEANRERVMAGEKLSDVQVQELLNTLSKEDMDAVQAVWDYLESFRPQIAAKERRLTGVEPDWVEPTPLLTKHGTYRGGYYPIKYDPLRSTRAAADTVAEVQKQIEHGLYARAQTRRGHLKARSESTGRPIRYDLGVLTEHVSQVIHDLAWHEFLVDARRLVNASAVNSAMRTHYGAYITETLRSTLTDIAIGEVGAQTSGDQVLNHIRFGATIAGLGWRVTTSLLQPIGLTQSAVRIGPKWVLQGARHWLGDAVRMDGAVKNMMEKSDFMRLRGKTLQREINEIRNKVEGTDSMMQASYFYLITKMQLVADLPTWYGAYDKAMSENDMTEDKAIALADQAVIDAQGGGQIKDLAQVQRGSTTWKLFTNFYSFFNTTYNLTAEAVGRTDFKSPGSVALLGVDLLLLYTIPAMLGVLMKVALKGEWGDEDALARKLIAEQINYLFGTMVLLREAGAVAGNIIDPKHGLDYTGPAGVRFFTELSALAKQVGQGEADEPFWKHLNSTAGILFQYPAGQINATLDGIKALAEGKTQNPGALLVGGPPNK